MQAVKGNAVIGVSNHHIVGNFDIALVHVKGINIIRTLGILDTGKKDRICRKRM
jgi:hypothetical protein